MGLPIGRQKITSRYATVKAIGGSRLERLGRAQLAGIDTSCLGMTKVVTDEKWSNKVSNKTSHFHHNSLIINDILSNKVSNYSQTAPKNSL